MDGAVLSRGPALTAINARHVWLYYAVKYTECWDAGFGCRVHLAWLGGK
jgi:hypothetical protein